MHRPRLLSFEMRATAIAAVLVALSCAHAAAGPEPTGQATAPPPAAAPPALTPAAQPAASETVVTARTAPAPTPTEALAPAPPSTEASPTDAGVPGGQAVASESADEPPAAAGPSGVPDAGPAAEALPSGVPDAGPASEAASPAPEIRAPPAHKDAKEAAPRPSHRPVQHAPTVEEETGGIPLAALEASKAPWPETGTEGINVVTGNAGPYNYAVASAYVNAPLASVLAALRDPNVVVDRRRVDAWEVDPPGDHPPPLFKVHNTVHGAAVVQFETTWRSGVVQGTAAKPKLVCARDRKTAGSSFINVLEDSIVARPVDAHTSAIEIVRHLKAMNVGTKEAEQYVRDVYANIVAHAHGQAVPRYK